jgi:L,D-transpeptidase ErfK/SrfK
MRRVAALDISIWIDRIWHARILAAYMSEFDLRAPVSLLAALAVAGCVFLPPETSTAPESAEQAAPVQPDRSAERLPALETRHVDLGADDQEVIGSLQVLFTRDENTFSAIAREYDVGYEELRYANPRVDHWLPGEETPVYLPTQHVLPDAPREGIVLNVPAMRLYYFSPPDDSSAAGRVTTYPVGIGRQGWATPTGTAKVTDKALDPVWYVPASVRAEHAAMGDPLPSVVPPGPDNPMGRHALALSIPGYLIHGTNKPAGVGMRVSHGCVRLYPEDIEALFQRVSRGTPVHIVDEPVLAGWDDGQLLLEVHPPLEEDPRDLADSAWAAIERALERAGVPRERVDAAAVAAVLEERRGIPLPVLNSDGSLEQYLVAASRVVENTVPPPDVEAAALAE